MKKYISVFLLVTCLLTTIPTYAAPNSSTPFHRTKVYNGEFSDVSSDFVFYENIRALYEYGLSIGNIGGTYGPSDNLTVGQTIIFAGRIRSLYRTGSPEKGPSRFSSPHSPAAIPYLLYLQAEGVLGKELDNTLGSPATRAQVAHVLSNLLPIDVLPDINAELVAACYASGRFIPDVSTNTLYQQDILSLYMKGVCVGSDAAGSYYPDAPITRGAVAAMLTRMIDSSLRLVPQWSLPSSYSAVGTRLSDLVTPGSYFAAPSTKEAMDETIRYMLSTDSNQLHLKYPSLSVIQAHQIMTAALTAVKHYCEQSYNQVSCSYTSSGSILLTFSASCSSSQIAKYRTDTMNAAIAVHDQLWRDGFLTEQMTQLEKALVYYTWICENSTYDYSATDTSISHIPYSLFYHGLAVCDGYTGAYNLLLKLEGIDCSAYFQDGHIWTTATLDGTEYHIDTTWGDAASPISYTYFAMTPELSMLYHK